MLSVNEAGRPQGFCCEIWHHKSRLEHLASFWPLACAPSTGGVTPGSFDICDDEVSIAAPLCSFSPISKTTANRTSEKQLAEDIS